MKYRPINIAWNNFSKESVEELHNSGMDNIPGLLDIIRTSMEYAFYKGACDTFDLIIESNRKVVEKEMKEESYMELLNLMGKDITHSLFQLGERLGNEVD